MIQKVGLDPQKNNARADRRRYRHDMISSQTKLRLLFICNLFAMAVNAVVAEIGAYKGNVWLALLSLFFGSVAFGIALLCRRAMRREDKLDIAMAVMQGHLPFNKLSREGLRFSVDGYSTFLLGPDASGDAFVLAYFVQRIRDDHPGTVRLWLRSPQ